jgi:hypothetical protein
MDDHRHIDSTVFITWPRRGYFENGDYTTALSHVIKWGWHEKTDNTIMQIYLVGMISDEDEKVRVSELVRLAKNWQYAPDLILKSDGFIYNGYEIKEKAYILTACTAQSELEFSINGSEKRPLINPVFVIKNNGRKDLIRLIVNDKEIKDYRSGFEGDDLVIWMPLNTTEHISVSAFF